MDLFGAGTGFQGTAGMAVDGAFGVDGGSRRELDQLQAALVQGASLAHHGAEGFHCLEIRRVLFLQAFVGIETVFAFHGATSLGHALSA